MMLIKGLVYTCFLLTCLPLYCLDSSDATTTEYAQEINDNLASLRRESEIMESRLNEMSIMGGYSEDDMALLDMRMMGMMNSQRNTTEQLERAFLIIKDYESSVLELEHKTKSRGRLLSILVYVVIIRILLVLVGCVLHLKRIQLPRWMDLLM